MSYHDYISEATLRYLMQQYPEHTPGWLATFTEEVHRLEQLWQVRVEGYERDSRFGTILYGQSESYGRVAVKIVPWFSPRLRGEVYCYQHLPYRELCPLYSVDERLGAMLLKYVTVPENPDPARREAAIAALYDQRRPATKEDEGHIPRYEDVLAGVTAHALGEIVRTGDAGYAPLALSIERAEKAMGQFSASERCLIHGDAHAFNLLEEGDSCLMIDPLGYIAPFAFEWARYLGTAMKEHPLPTADFHALVLRLTRNNAPLEEALRAFAIDTTLRACNTFIEGNTYEEICFAADWARRAWGYYDALVNT
ncbi:MAG: hypothetical protein ACI4WX_15265 [Aristaeellaceae bacterium]